MTALPAHPSGPVPVPATITVEEAGRILGIGRSAAYRAVARGEIPSIKIGNRVLVPLAKLCAILGLPLDAIG